MVSRRGSLGQNATDTDGEYLVGRNTKDLGVIWTVTDASRHGEKVVKVSLYEDKQQQPTCDNTQISLRLSIVKEPKH